MMQTFNVIYYGFLLNIYLTRLMNQCSFKTALFDLCGMLFALKTMLTAKTFEQ